MLTNPVKIKWEGVHTMLQS